MKEQERWWGMLELWKIKASDTANQIKRLQEKQDKQFYFILVLKIFISLFLKWWCIIIVNENLVPGIKIFSMCPISDATDDSLTEDSIAWEL